MNTHPLLVNLLLIASLVACHGQESTPIIADGVERQTASEERITYISGNDTLVGYLSSPQTERPYPVIVVLHSASHGHHDNDLYNHLETQMNDMGVGVFTYDRRGSGESTGDFNTASLPTLAQDALNAIEELRTRSDIDTDRIGLFGISQGGWLGPIAYSISPSDISFMILVSSSGVSPADQMEYSAVTTLKMNGHSQEVIDKAIHLRNITNAYYRGRRDRESTQEEIDRFREEEWFNDVYLPWQGNLPNDVGVTKWIHEMDLDPVEYFQHVDIPIALFYGATDRWVPIEESMDVWRTVFEKNGNTNFEFHRIDRAGHMMIMDEDNEPEVEIISDEYTRALKRWVVENVFE